MYKLSKVFLGYIVITYRLNEVTCSESYNNCKAL